MNALTLTRRGVLAGVGGLVVAFSTHAQGAPRPGSLKETP
jgi:hypothetical protein